MSKKKIISLAVGVIIVAGIAIWAFGGQAKKRKVVYETATVDRANISNSVTATGTIEPVTEVEVGTQVSGIIDRLYADYNSVVTKGAAHCRNGQSNPAKRISIAKGYLRRCQSRI